MRGALSALALLAVAMVGTASVQAQTVPNGLTSDDARFYGQIATARAGQARTGETVSWSANGRSGTVKFEDDANNCKTFFLTETGRAPATGRVCPLSNTGTATIGVYVASNVRAAAAAGPRAEPPAAPARPTPPIAETSPPRSLPPTGGVPRGLPSPGSGSGTPRSVPRSLPPPAPPPPPPPPPPAAPAPAQKQVAAPPPTSTTQPSVPDLDVRGRIVPLRRLEPRIAGAGGHAVVLMTHPANYTDAQQRAHQRRNKLLCLALLDNFRETTYERVEVGTEKEKDGTTVRIRPIYWPQSDRQPVRGDRCTELMTTYDTTRAAAILDKSNERNPGPFLMVSRDNQTQAALIDMTSISDAQIAKMVEYFRFRFSQKPDVWLPAETNVAQTRGGLLAVFGNLFTDNLTAAVRLFDSRRDAATKTACIGDQFDVRFCR